MPLKAHPELNEKWLQQRIVDNPSLLGLGDLEVKEVERRQRTGRLDLLLRDSDAGTRYCVEIQLGPTDEAHIIRCIEYWDVERTRYPNIDHVAVLVAEDITSRFLNVISLFNKAIPLVALQMRALQVGDVLTLHATTVLDLTRIGEPDDEDDDATNQPTTRADWVQKATPEMVALADDVLVLVNDVTGGGWALSYRNTTSAWRAAGSRTTSSSSGLARRRWSPRSGAPALDETTALIEDAGIDTLPYDKKWGRYRLRLTAVEIEKEEALLRELIRRAAGLPAVAAEDALSPIQ